MNAVVFSGQGAQYKGMGKDLYDNFPQAKRVFSYIDELLGMEISRICFSGEELKGLYNQQLAILATSLATYEVFKERAISVDFFSGLSFGEYSSLYPGGVLTLEELVYLVKKRAEESQKASKIHPSSMLAVIGLEKSRLERLAKLERFYIANINSLRQIVVSLKNEDRERIKNLLKAEGARVVELDTGGGFHCPFMEPARDSLKRFAEELNFCEPNVPIVSNLTGRATKDKDEIRRNIVDQLIHTTLWKDCVEFMVKVGVDTFFEIGPSRVLRRLIKDITPDVKVINIREKEDFDNL